MQKHLVSKIGHNELIALLCFGRTKFRTMGWMGYVWSSQTEAMHVRSFYSERQG